MIPHCVLHGCALVRVRDEPADVHELARDESGNSQPILEFNHVRVHTEVPANGTSFSTSICFDVSRGNYVSSTQSSRGLRIIFAKDSPSSFRYHLLEFPVDRLGGLHGLPRIAGVVLKQLGEGCLRLSLRFLFRFVQEVL